jgi:hypothetical protein
LVKIRYISIIGHVHALTGRIMVPGRSRTTPTPPRSPWQSRGTALLTLAADVPAAILAKTLGIHVKAAIQWQKISGGNRSANAADISRRGQAQEQTRARDQRADPLPSA